MITDIEARKIASEWHERKGTTLYAFTSTDAIDTARSDHDIDAEIADCETALSEASSLERGEEDEEVACLRHYVKHHGKRGPVNGWAKLTW